ncbi:MAG: hypothetical protein PHP59_10195 [Methanofollis sp.]|uniref:hypothetical protein n=1 Tax=Methanofollis sp. TaxID=2052835 RepID=UPI002626D9CD|nr:hypothetical protein [Methanofollis sp.]MDD4255727.1 hypothetical protein [Methanofollis sp.]
MSFGTTLKLDEDGDLVVSSMHRLALVTGTEKATQDLTVILRSLKGSLPLNTAFGTDYLAMIDAGRNAEVIRHEIRAALETYPYLQSVDDIAVSLKGRSATAIIRATLTDGTAVSLEAVV